MIEDFIKTAVGTLLSEGGAGWAVAVIIGAWVFVLDRRLLKSQSDYDAQALEANKAVQDQYEKRLVEFKIIIDAMTNSTATVKAMHGSITATSEAINQLAQGFTKLLGEFQAQSNRWGDRGEGMAKTLDDIRQRIESLQRGHK